MGSQSLYFFAHSRPVLQAELYHRSSSHLVDTAYIDCSWYHNRAQRVYRLSRLSGQLPSIVTTHSTDRASFHQQSQHHRQLQQLLLQRLHQRLPVLHRSCYAHPPTVARNVHRPMMGDALVSPADAAHRLTRPCRYRWIGLSKAFVLTLQQQCYPSRGIHRLQPCRGNLRRRLQGVLGHCSGCNRTPRPLSCALLAQSSSASSCARKRYQP